MLLLKMVSEDVERVIVGADADQGVLDIAGRTEQFYRDRLPRGNAFALRGHADDAVGADERHESARAPRYGSGDQVSGNAPELHADELFLAERRCHLPAQLCRDRPGFGRPAPKEAVDERPDEEVD